jgi:DNA-binding transcriptional ArsR family regulator
MKKKEQIKEIYTIKELEQVKALSKPIRLRLLEAFCREALTTKQAAAAIGEMQVTRLYHHVEALERAGLIRLVKTVRNRGTMEKYYQTVAKKFAVDQRLLTIAPAQVAQNSIISVFASTLEETLTEIRDSITAELIGAGEARPAALMSHVHIRATTAQAGKIMKKIEKLLSSCQQAAETEDEKDYALTVVFYPLKAGQPAARARKK